MIKKILVLFAFLAIMVACNNSQKNTSEKDASADPVTITVNDFLAKADEYVGKEIRIQGTVSHTCRNGGKKMFLFEDSEDNRAKIEASESVPSFDVSLEGSDVLVSGKVSELKIDEAFLSKWEQEVNGEMNNPEEENDTVEVTGHEGGGLGEAADQGTHVSALESIAEYRRQIKESGKDHLSFYSVECNSYEILPTDTIN